MKVPALRPAAPNLFHQEKIHHWKQIYVNNLFILIICIQDIHFLHFGSDRILSLLFLICFFDSKN